MRARLERRRPDPGHRAPSADLDRPKWRRGIGLAVATLWSFHCGPSAMAPDAPWLSLRAVAADPTTVLVEAPLPNPDEELAPLEGGRFRIEGALGDGASPLEVRRVRRQAGRGLRIETTPQRSGALYALKLPAGPTQSGYDIPEQLNFRGYGETEVRFVFDARRTIHPDALTLLLTVDPATRRPGARLFDYPMVATSEGVFETRVFVVRTAAAQLSARVESSGGQAASALVRFPLEVGRQTVTIDPTLPEAPEFDAPDDRRAGDGRATVRILVDDRPARALDRPELVVSVDERGDFDLGASRVLPLAPLPGQPRVYAVELDVTVDARRTLDGQTPDTFPYVAQLRADGVTYAARAVAFTVPEEGGFLYSIRMGNADLVPVTFRVDVGAAILRPDARQRGLFEGEGVFLTGEFPRAEDAFGRLAADAFTGGERATLEMDERPDAPGVYEKTIFLPPDRPYGWKVVRCPSGEGCTVLNRRVTSSGRAFPTVMKNLVTHNLDAAEGQSVVVDPAALTRVSTPDGRTVDYRDASVSTSGAEPPGPSVLFKQEVPDLVVRVQTAPVVTPTYVVGTWRDVNLPRTPLELIASTDLVDLTEFDYDDGLQGGAPLTRAEHLPLDPKAPATGGAFDPFDGVPDLGAEAVVPGVFAAWRDGALYLATEPVSGSDDLFVVVFAEPGPSNQSVPAPWNKSGQVPDGAAGFLAAEGDGDFAGWFWTQNGPAQLDDAVPTSRGAVIETVVPWPSPTDGVPPRLWVARVAYQTLDGGSLQPAHQQPPGNGDGDLQPGECVAIVPSAPAP